MQTLLEPQSEPTWRAVIRLLRWNKPAGRFILMVPALWAVFLAAKGTPPLPLVGVIFLGTFATSAAGCVINDLWDRDIDPQVERTSDRPLASRALTVRTGIVVAFVALCCAAVLALYLNSLSFWLCVAAVPVIVCYPLAKRVFPVPQLVLSIAWGFAVLICWTAAVSELEMPTWILWGATVLWTLGFDTVYAMPDREDDRRLGVNSSALFFGDYACEAVAILFLGTAGLFAWLGTVMHLHLAFWIALAIGAIVWAGQYLQLRAVERPSPDAPQDMPKPYGKIFSQNVGIGFTLLAGIIVGILA